MTPFFSEGECFRTRWTRLVAIRPPLDDVLLPGPWSYTGCSSLFSLGLSMQQLRVGSAEFLEALDLTFSIEVETETGVAERGLDIRSPPVFSTQDRVNQSNVEEYVRLMAEYKVWHCIPCSFLLDLVGCATLRPLLNYVVVYLWVFVIKA